jgi:hypothetical protein
MRVGRADEDRVEAALGLNVVRELTCAGDQSPILASLDATPKRGIHRH